jgi:hypothetical protein
LLLALRRERLWICVARSVAFSLPPVVSGWVAHLAWGNPLAAVFSYAAKDSAAPLQSLIRGFGAFGDDPLKALQVLFALGLAAAGMFGLLWRWQDARGFSGGAERLEESAWLMSTVVFYLLLPSQWTFECLARYLISAVPAILLGLEPWLPRRWNAVAAVGIASFGLCVHWTVRALAHA